ENLDRDREVSGGRRVVRRPRLGEQALGDTLEMPVAILAARPHHLLQRRPRLVGPPETELALGQPEGEQRASVLEGRLREPFYGLAQLRHAGGGVALLDERQSQV